LRADTLFIRAQSTIRADGAPSAQARSLPLDMSIESARGAGDDGDFVLEPGLNHAFN
jgi:hypothetical protein